jgi:bifunctional non-homologous end joining protein LigD
LFPEAKLVKRDMALYYEAIADWILPHLADRPLALVRCPDGWSKQCFFQKHADKSVNAAVTRVQVPESDGTATYFAANSLPALVALVQWGVVELHPWGSRTPKLDRPDRLIFDFDPDDGIGWKQIVEAVGVLRALLDDLGLEGFLKTTGGKGLQSPCRSVRRSTGRRRKDRAVADLLSARSRPLYRDSFQRQRKGRSSTTCAMPKARLPSRRTRSAPAPRRRCRRRSHGTSSTPMSASITSTSAMSPSGCAVCARIPGHRSARPVKR